MNILIINAFGNSQSGKSKFSSFTKIIKNIFKSLSQNSLIETFNYIIKEPNNLDEYLYDYEFNTNETTTKSNTKKKNFEKIDIIFIDGTEKYLPWEDKGLKLCSFIKLCKLTDKILFASGVAMESLIYYLATGSQNDFNFINSNGELQSIEELNKIPESFLKELKKNDHFLDFVTGDVMEYQNINKNWISVMNIGLHKQNSAEKYFKRGKFVLYDNFIGKDYFKNTNSISSNCKELKVHLTKQFFSHYLNNNLPIEFTVYSTLTWFPHNFNVSYKKYQFKIIGISFKGPVLIEHDNSVGCAFHINNNYKESIIIIENFIKKKFSEIQEKLFKFSNLDNNSYSVEEINPMFRNFKINDEQKNRKIKENKENGFKSFSCEGIVNSSSRFNRIKKVQNIANFVGFGINNRDMIFVENNSINQRPVSCVNELIKKKNVFHKKSNSDFKVNNNPIIKRNENTRISQIFKFDLIKSNIENYSIEKKKENRKKFFENAKKELEKNYQNNEDFMRFVNKEKMEEDEMINYYKKIRKDINEKLKEIKIASEFKLNKYQTNKNEQNQNNKKKIKLNIFRNSTNNNNIKSITSRNKNNNDNLNNGLSSNPSFPHQSYFKHSHKIYGTYSLIDPKLKPETTFPELSIDNKINNKEKKKFNKNLLIENINNSNINNEYRYITLEEFERKEFLQSKKKWISKEDFHRFFGLHTTALKPIPNAMESGTPISKYKYRDEFPDKWLTSNGFVV